MSEHKSLRPSPTALLNPRCDPSFKAMFTQNTPSANAALADFISAMIGRTVTHVELTANEPAADLLDELQMSFDVGVTFDGGERAAIEMQGKNRDYGWTSRAEIQCARLLAVSAKKGSSWHAPCVYQMSVLNFTLRECEDGAAGGPGAAGESGAARVSRGGERAHNKDDKRPFSWYTMREKGGAPLSGLMNILFLELPKLRSRFGTPPEKLSKLEKWGLFLLYADSPDAQEYIAALLKNEGGLMNAKTALTDISEDERNWWIQNSYDIARRDREEEMQNTLARGRAEGEVLGLARGEERGLVRGRAEGEAQGFVRGCAEGEQKAKLEMAKLMLANNMPLADIVTYTGLFEEVIRSQCNG